MEKELDLLSQKHRNVILILIHEFNSSMEKIGKKLSIARSAVSQKQLLLSMVVTKYLMVHLNTAENHNDTVRMFRNSKQSGIPS